MNIDFSSYNWVDLSCVPLTQGHLFSGKLIRSASLDAFSLEAWSAVQEQIPVSLVVDLRTGGEISEMPFVFTAASRETCTRTAYANLPMDGMVFLMNERAQLHPRRLDWKKTRRKLWSNPAYYLPEMYSRMVVAPNNIASLKSFFTLATLPRKGALLWHCAQGTDRTGIVTMLLLEVLGASREAIFENYLSCYAHSTDADIACCALQAAYEAIEQHAGSVDAYLEHQLGVGPHQRRALQSLYVSA